MAEFTSLNGYQVKDTIARSIAKGRNQAVAFADYATMIETLNEFEKDEYRAGQNVYIGVVGVPDLWVYSVEDIRHTFTYTSDEDFVEMLKSNTTVQVGFFKLAMLEGQKVDLTTVNEQLTEHTNDIAEINTEIGELNSSLGNLEFNVSEGKPQWREAGADTWNFFSSGVDFKQLYSNTAVDAGTTSKTVSLSYTLTQDYDYILVSTAGSAFRVIGEQSPSGFAIGSAYTVSISNSYTPIFQSGNIKVYKDVKSGTKITASNFSSQSSGVKIWIAVMMSIYTV